MWKLRNHRRWLFGKMFRITVVVQDFWRNMCLSSYYGKQIFGLWWTLLVILDMIHWTLWVLGVIIRSPFLVSTTRRNAGQLGHGLASTFQRYNGKQIFGLWWTLLVILDMIHWTLWVLGVIIRSPFLVSTTRRNAGQLGHGLASTFQRYKSI